jgi:hypothetical protein
MVAVNETITGLSELGTDLGGFMTNIAPGIGAFIIIVGVFGGIGALIYAIVALVKNKINIR